MLGLRLELQTIYLAFSTDIAPSLLELVGDAFHNPVDGQSLVPLLSSDPDNAVLWREDLMVETLHQHKYVDNDDPLHELYDLEAEPYQLHNLNALPEMAHVYQSMWVRLRRWREETGDQDAATPAYQKTLADEDDLLAALVRRRTIKAGIVAPAVVSG